MAQLFPRAPERPAVDAVQLRDEAGRPARLHTLGWSYVVGQLAFASDGLLGAGLDPLMRNLDAQTRLQPKLYASHVRARSHGYEVAREIAAELEAGERPVDYRAPLPATPRGESPGRPYRLPTRPLLARSRDRTRPSSHRRPRDDRHGDEPTA